MKGYSCDRCGKFYSEAEKEEWEKDRLFSIHEKVPLTNGTGVIDLCDDCYQSLKDWTHISEWEDGDGLDSN